MRQTYESGGTWYKSPTLGATLPYWIHRARAWHIEYGGYFANHLTHNLVALSGAGADDARLSWWEELYTNQGKDQPARELGYLEPARRSPEGAPVLSETNWAERIENDRSLFPTYRDFFDTRVAMYGIAESIRRYVPTLLPGLVGSAFHPVIHTGWGVDASSSVMVAEGLAYMATAFQPLAANGRDEATSVWQPGRSGIISDARQFLDVAKTQDFSRIADEVSRSAAYRALNKGEFQARVLTFEDEALPLGAALNRVVLGLPPVGEPLHGAVEEATALCAAALEASDNEFFVLHGLTSLHGLLALMPHLDEAAQRDALAYWWRGVMAAMVAEDLPGAAGTVERLERWRTEHRVGQRYALRGGDRAWWKETLHVTFPSLDEHVPKAAYALWRWSDWETFSPATTTLFRTAARHLTRPNPSGYIHENITFGRTGADASRARMMKSRAAAAAHA